MPRHLPQHHRQHGPGLRPGRAATAPACPGPRLLPDHPGLRHPAHALGLKRFGVMTMQAEDEIAGVGIALGASFGGALGVTTTSGPGLASRPRRSASPSHSSSRWSSSTSSAAAPRPGLPTKTEQADLLQAMFGRNGEAPVPVVAPAPRGLLRRRHRGVPHRGHLPARRSSCSPTATSPTAPSRGGCPTSPTSRPRPGVRHRDPTPRRPRASRLPPLPARPGDPRPAVGGARHPGLEHRIGGIEKADITGNISYDPTTTSG
jgi:2-oxoglutarate ferredoxin oxidoreductase subunit alpha